MLSIDSLCKNERVCSHTLTEKTENHLGSCGITYYNYMWINFRTSWAAGALSPIAEELVGRGESRWIVVQVAYHVALAQIQKKIINWFVNTFNLGRCIMQDASMDAPAMVPNVSPDRDRATSIKMSKIGVYYLTVS